jgi:hypothetical protein
LAHTDAVSRDQYRQFSIAPVMRTRKSCFIEHGVIADSSSRLPFASCHQRAPKFVA